MSAKECLEHSWLAQHTENMSRVALSTEKLKKFLVRRKWQVIKLKSEFKRNNIFVFVIEMIINF